MDDREYLTRKVDELNEEFDCYAKLDVVGEDGSMGICVEVYGETHIDAITSLDAVDSRLRRHGFETAYVHDDPDAAAPFDAVLHATLVEKGGSPRQPELPV